MVSGLLALTSASPALAQKAAKPAAPAGKAPAKAAAPAAPAKGAAAPAKGAAPAKPLTEKQKKDAARKAYKEAEAKFKDGKYAEALELYKTADEMLPISATKYKIAVCRDKLSQSAIEVAGAYQVFLDSSPDDKKMGDQIAEAKTRLDALKKTPGKIRVQVMPPDVPKLALQVDTGASLQASTLPTEMVAEPAPAAPGPAGAPPPPPTAPPVKATALTLPPGHHKLSVTGEGFDPASTEFDLGFGETKDVKVALNATPPPPPPPPPPVAQEPPPPPPPPPAPPRSNVPAYVTLGLAGAGLVVGGVFGGLALSAKSEFNKTPTTDNADKTDRNALIADMSFAVALTFGVTGAVLLLSNDSPPPAGETKTGHAPTKKKSAVRGFVTPYAGPNGGGAVGVLTF